MIHDFLSLRSPVPCFRDRFKPGAAKSYDLRKQQVDALSSSIFLSSNLFRSARADYMEVLLTQRDALESKFELEETQKQRMNAMVNMYHALGGGWK